jgi:hypothetical protein
LLSRTTVTLAATGDECDPYVSFDVLLIAFALLLLLLLPG